MNSDGSLVNSGTLNGDESIIRYNIYVPINVQNNEILPVVYVLHGGGGRFGPIARLLETNEDATIWAEDSENDHNRTIVLHPQASIDVNGSNASWYSGTPYPSIFREGEAAYECSRLLLMVIGI
jgi:predicted peptidase